RERIRGTRSRRAIAAFERIAHGSRSATDRGGSENGVGGAHRRSAAGTQFLRVTDIGLGSADYAVRGRGIGWAGRAGSAALLVDVAEAHCGAAHGRARREAVRGAGRGGAVA